MRLPFGIESTIDGGILSEQMDQGRCSWSCLQEFQDVFRHPFLVLNQPRWKWWKILGGGQSTFSETSDLGR